MDTYKIILQTYNNEIKRLNNYYDLQKIIQIYLYKNVLDKYNNYLITQSNRIEICQYIQNKSKNIFSTWWSKKNNTNTNVINQCKNYNIKNIIQEQNKDIIINEIGPDFLMKCVIEKNNSLINQEPNLIDKFIDDFIEVCKTIYNSAIEKFKNFCQQCEEIGKIIKEKAAEIYNKISEKVKNIINKLYDGYTLLVEFLNQMKNPTEYYSDFKAFYNRINTFYKPKIKEIYKQNNMSSLILNNKETVNEILSEEDLNIKYALYDKQSLSKWENNFTKSLTEKIKSKKESFNNLAEFDNNITTESIYEKPENRETNDSVSSKFTEINDKILKRKQALSEKSYILLLLYGGILLSIIISIAFIWTGLSTIATIVFPPAGAAVIISGYAVTAHMWYTAFTLATSIYTIFIQSEGVVDSISSGVEISNQLSNIEQQLKNNSNSEEIKELTAADKLDAYFGKLLTKDFNDLNDEEKKNLIYYLIYLHKEYNIQYFNHEKINSHKNIGLHCLHKPINRQIFSFYYIYKFNLTDKGNKSKYFIKNYIDKNEDLMEYLKKIIENELIKKQIDKIRSKFNENITDDLLIVHLKDYINNYTLGKAKRLYMHEQYFAIKLILNYLQNGDIDIEY